MFKPHDLPDLIQQSGLGIGNNLFHTPPAQIAFIFLIFTEYLELLV